jgi:hypothetical protein
MADVLQFTMRIRPRTQSELAARWPLELKALSPEDTRLLEDAMHRARKFPETVVIDYGPEFAKHRSVERYQVRFRHAAIADGLAVIYDPSSPSI